MMMAMVALLFARIAASAAAQAASDAARAISSDCALACLLLDLLRGKRVKLSDELPSVHVVTSARRRT
jgi:hypothetical protein